MRRRLQHELMDDPELEATLHHAALKGLERINAVSRTADVLWSCIERIALNRGLGSIRVLDVACGGADVLTRLARRAGQRGRDVRWFGCDVSPQAIDIARRYAAERGASLELFVADAITDSLPEDCDFVICSLFLHHLDRAKSLRLLGNLREAAKQAVLVDDLIRGRLAYAIAWTGCRLLSRSPIVHFDGPASVAGAYTIGEARELASQSGLDGASFTRHWPFRFLMEWELPE